MNKGKTTALVMAVTLSASILLTGTFAWRSISQEAKNELIRINNPGGRLHDDFDGTNKDVYVENFFSVNEGGQPIFARIRLDEYMEVGEDAGTKVDDPARKARPLVAGAKIGDVTTWTTHVPKEDAPEAADDPFHTYWKWTMGGKTVYMPTFNKNKDSLQADINGTWEGKTPGDAAHFDDYIKYELNEKKKDNAAYDNDPNDLEDAGIDWVEETHTAKETRSAQVVSMKQWKALGCPMGEFWVYDKDGWAYWAQAIAPGDTTGLLLDGIDYISADETPCYYGINVVAQFATAGDWGEPGDAEAGKEPTGFYAPTAGKPPTADALFLLKQAAGLDYTVELGPKTPPPEGGEVTVAQGGTLELQVTVKCGGKALSGPAGAVTWTIADATQETTQVDENGILTVAAGEPVGTVLTIEATAWEGTSARTTVKVVPPPPPPEPEPGA